MEIGDISTSLWLPRETGLESFFERREENTTSESGDILAIVGFFPTYLPTAKLREIMSKGIFVNVYG